MNCPSCGMYVPAGADICAHCRTPVEVPGTSHHYNAQTVYYDYGTPQASSAQQSQLVRTDRTLIGWLLLTIITFGIYHLYYVYRLAKDVNVMCNDGDRTGGLAMYVVAGFFTFGIYNIYWYYKIMKRLTIASYSYCVPSPWTAVGVTLWMTLGLCLFGLGPLVGMYEIIRTANAVSYAYNGNRAHTKLPL